MCMWCCPNESSDLESEWDEEEYEEDERDKYEELVEEKSGCCCRKKTRTFDGSTPPLPDGIGGPN